LPNVADQAQLEVEVDQERATVRSGKSRFVLSTLPAAEFPAVEEVNSLWDIMSNNGCSSS